jgi:hypothetical protein
LHRGFLSGPGKRDPLLKSRRQSWQIPVHANRVEKYSSYMLTIGQGRRLCPLKTQNVMEDLEFRGLQPYRRGCRRKRSSWLHSLFVDKSPCVEFNGTHAQYDSIDALTVSHTTSIAACIERASRRPILKSGVHTGRDSLRPSDSEGSLDVKCNNDQVKRLRRALKREKNPTMRQRIQPNNPRRLRRHA